MELTMRLDLTPSGFLPKAMKTKADSIQSSLDLAEAYK